MAEASSQKVVKRDAAPSEPECTAPGKLNTFTVHGRAAAKQKGTPQQG
jgi:hypothetical protein